MNAAQVKPRLIRDNGVWECALGNAHHVGEQHFTGTGLSPLCAWNEWAIHVGPTAPAEGWERDKRGHYYAPHPAFPW